MLDSSTLDQCTGLSRKISQRTNKSRIEKFSHLRADSLLDIFRFPALLKKSKPSLAEVAPLIPEMLLEKRNRVLHEGEFDTHSGCVIIDANTRLDQLLLGSSTQARRLEDGGGPAVRAVLTTRAAIRNNRLPVILHDLLKLSQWDLGLADER